MGKIILGYRVEGTVQNTIHTATKPPYKKVSVTDWPTDWLTDRHCGSAVAASNFFCKFFSPLLSYCAHAVSLVSITESVFLFMRVVSTLCTCVWYTPRTRVTEVFSYNQKIYLLAGTWWSKFVTVLILYDSWNNLSENIIILLIFWLFIIYDISVDAFGQYSLHLSVTITISHNYHDNST